MVFAALAGAATIATFAVTIVMGQEYLPGRLGDRAGVTIGLSIGLGGVGAPLLGLLADAPRPDGRVRADRVLPLLALVLALPRPALALTRSSRLAGPEDRPVRETDVTASRGGVASTSGH